MAESEDVINGKEYTRRLRRQFQRMHPTPEWANPELAAMRRKANSDSDASGEEMDSDEEDEQLSMQPLAKLLQNATDLTRVEDNARSGGKRKLRQEVLDIQRLKDVGKAQPVRLFLCVHTGIVLANNCLCSSPPLTRSISTHTTHSCFHLALQQLSSCTTFLPQHHPPTPS